ncbi:hypothetical protein [Dactylosporangium sp. NPDC000521]|uniref:hypothetical protein n=1 Tax=Dactylosporangium sp. NPDC000521 TaxID=3363975 RepID=UPI0036C8BC55
MLQRYGELLRRAGDDAAAGHTHLQRFAVRDASGGDWIGWFGPFHEQAVDDVHRVLARFHAVADAAGDGLHAAARYYTSTDRAVADRFDAQLPPGACPPGDLGRALDQMCLPGWSMRDLREPQHRLHAPEAEDPTGPAGIPIGYLDTLSLSGAALHALKAVFGFDPVERLVRPLLGDWEHIAACGAVLHQLAALCGDIAVNVAAGDRTLMTSWHGNAAAAADDYFTTLAVRTDHLAAPITDLADLHHQAATAVHTAGEAIEAAITRLHGIPDLELSGAAYHHPAVTTPSGAHGAYQTT